ncbi:MAG: BON domain-containing protein [Caulobacterales bacterium]|nr:BON domain-containing protein [Caulobacterales bacterium]
MAEHEGPYAGKGPKGWTPSDLALCEEVSDRMLQDRLLDARGVEVSADAGVIVLTGEVPGASDVAHAEMLARATPGVVDVKNRLVVHPGPRAVDKLAPREAAHYEGRWGRWVPPFIT